MVAKGDMVYAWTTNADIAKVAECGGAVTGLLKFALENDIVDGVLAVKKGVDIYDAVPTLITDPAEVAGTAGSLHCGTLLLAKLIKNTQWHEICRDGEGRCDGIYELRSATRST